MNEPISVPVEMLSLQLLAGKDHKTCDPLIPVSDLRHLPVSITALWPLTSTLPVKLFQFEVPKNQCYIVTYVSLYQTNVADGLNDWNFNEFIAGWWASTVNNNTKVITQSGGVNIINLINSPCLMVFKEKEKPQVLISSETGTTPNSIALYARMNGYLAPMKAYNSLIKYQTIFTQ